MLVKNKLYSIGTFDVNFHTFLWLPEKGIITTAVFKH